MEYLYPLNAIHSSGEVILLYSIDEARAFVTKHGEFENHHFEYQYGYSWTRIMRTKFNHWIVRDDRGRVVKCEDLKQVYHPNYWINKHRAEIRKLAEKGQLPSTRRRWKKHNHVAKKNSGSGHRNRNRARAIYEAQEYKIANNVGNRVIPWEGY